MSPFENFVQFGSSVANLGDLGDNTDSTVIGVGHTVCYRSHLLVNLEFHS